MNIKKLNYERGDNLMELILQQILTKIDNVESVMVTKKELTDLKIGIDERLDGIDERLDGMDERLDERFNIINKKLFTISEQIAHNAEQEIRINKLETEVKVIKKTIANL